MKNSLSVLISDLSLISWQSAQGFCLFAEPMTKIVLIYSDPHSHPPSENLKNLVKLTLQYI